MCEGEARISESAKSINDFAALIIILLGVCVILCSI